MNHGRLFLTSKAACFTFLYMINQSMLDRVKVLMIVDAEVEALVRSISSEDDMESLLDLARELERSL